MNRLHLYVFKLEGPIPEFVGVEAYSIEQAYEEALIWDPGNWDLVYCKALQVNGGEQAIVFT